MGRIVRVWLTGVVLAWTAMAAAQSPEDLIKWEDWIKDKYPNLDCPISNSKVNQFEKAETQPIQQRRCYWYHSLELDVERRLAEFDLRVRAYKEGFIQLPGNGNYWPMEVRWGSDEMQVVERNGLPFVFVQPGRYRIQGTLQWGAIPKSIQFNNQTALITVKRGRNSEVVHPDEMGRVWLESDVSVAEEQGEVSGIRVQVFRKLTDGIPLEVTTHLILEVSGPDRQVELGRFLLEGFELVELNSPLSATVDQNGVLSATLSSGRWELSARARQLEKNNQFNIMPVTPNWPTQEIWSLQSDSELRAVQLTGGRSIDPQQTNLPSSWKPFPAYLMVAEEKIKLNETERGNRKTVANDLQLKKELWLDPEGEGFTVRDTLEGANRGNWRFNLTPQLKPGSAHVGGKPSVISVDQNGLTGLEVRKQNTDVELISRQQRDSWIWDRQLVSGWQLDLQSQQTELHLPSGWRVIGVLGADWSRNNWLGNWDLWGVFIWWLLAISAARLFGFGFGVMTFVLIGMTFHNPLMPVYSLLILFGLIGLSQLSSIGKWKTTLLPTLQKWVYLFMVTFSVLFFVQKAHWLLYLDEDMYPNSYASTQFTDLLDQDAPYLKQPMAMSEAAEEVIEEVYVMGSRIRAPEKSSMVDPSAPYGPTQTGPGVPIWTGKIVSFGWQNFIDQRQDYSLVLSPPWLSRLAVIFQVLLLLNLLRALADRIWKSTDQQDLPPSSDANNSVPTGHNSVAVAFMMVLGGLLAMGTESAKAEYPSDALLKEYEKRLIAPPSCMPNCGAFNGLYLQLDSQQLFMRMEISTAALIDVPLPIRRGQWWPEKMLIDGDRVRRFTVDEKGQLRVALPKGNHRIELSGSVSDIQQFQLEFDWPAHNVRTMVNDWSVAGLEGRALTGKSLSFERRYRESVNVQNADVNIKPFVKVNRRVYFENEWYVVTEVERIAPKRQGFSLEIPLLLGEQPLTQKWTVDDGKIKVNLEYDQPSVIWRSSLAEADQLLLSADVQENWFEEWFVYSTERWQVSHQGIAPIGQGSDIRVYHWRPWPSEWVKLNIKEPYPFEGETLTLEKLDYEWNIGQRQSSGSWRMAIRASKGQSVMLTVPKGIEINDITNHRSVVPLNLKGELLEISVPPGRNDYLINWKWTGDIDQLYSLPKLKWSTNATNVHYQVNLPQNKWILFLWGPQQGAKLLYWPILLLVWVFAFIITKQLQMPISTGAWLLLALGLATSNLAGFAMFALWIVGLGVKKRYLQQMLEWPKWKYNVSQASLFILGISALIGLAVSIPNSLLGNPDMHIAGAGSMGNSLSWYEFNGIKQSAGIFAMALPLWVYKAFMLLWAFWLASRLIKWMKWSWACYSAGHWWRK